MGKYPNWSEPEARYLDTLAGDVPFPELVAKYQAHASRQRWPQRSNQAILQRLHRTRQHGRARQGACLTTGGVADILGCPQSRVGAWLNRREIRDILQPRRVGHFWYIERTAWRELARRMPQVLGGYSLQALYTLLEDRELAREVQRRCPGRLGDKRIRCIETGRIYASLSDAARRHHVSYSTISLAIKEGRPVTVLGLSFERVRESRRLEPSPSAAGSTPAPRA